MPPLRRWVQFLASAGGLVGVGVLFVKYGTPTDEQFLKELSPELRARYLREKPVREKASELLQQNAKETEDKPAWLQGSRAMRKIDREIADRARKAVEDDEQRAYLESERQRLKELAEKERRR